jgi:hypothetical protein
MSAPLILIKSRPRPPAATQVSYVALGRHDLVALIHGLPDRQALAWVRIVAEALSLGVETLPTRRCAEIGGSHWPLLLARLQHAQRIAANGDEIEIIWVKEALFAARRRAKAARDRGAARGKNSD